MFLMIQLSTGCPSNINAAVLMQNHCKETTGRSKLLSILNDTSQDSNLGSQWCKNGATDQVLMQKSLGYSGYQVTATALFRISWMICQRDRVSEGAVKQMW